MYNYSGIWYNIITRCGIILILGIICLLIQRPWQSPSPLKNLKYILLCLVVSVSFFLFYVSRIVNTDISMTNGVFEKSNRRNGFEYRFTFSSLDEKKQNFLLDLFTYKELLPTGFEQGKTYEIYYDEATNIIVKITELEVVER